MWSLVIKVISLGLFFIVLMFVSIGVNGLILVVLWFVLFI